MSTCLNCHRKFRSRKALQSHYQQQYECNNHFLKYQLQLQNIESPMKQSSSLHQDTSIDSTIDLCNDNDHYTECYEKYSFNNCLIDQTIKRMHNKHQQSGFTNLIESDSLIQSQVDLLVILKQAKVPLYLFDEIWKWTKQSANCYNIDFGSVGAVSRMNCIKKLKNNFDLHGLDPKKKRVTLKGSNNEIDIIVHDFDYCLYSLLNDELLMNPDNLLIDTQYDTKHSN
jgi:hypothetical protein